ncbi:hypothetical protein, partial [Nostoc sp. UIC 10630]|uniref:hypothetical protein n=1 Tax=Nostoc sp. UIC 10630 TaxID=2100146 RepID=UPI0013D72866
VYLIYNLYRNESQVIELIDTLGKEFNIRLLSYSSRRTPKRFEPFVQEFANKFSIKPELLGVLKLLSYIHYGNTNLLKAISIIPKNLLDIAKFSNLEDKESAAILSLIRGDISLEEIKLVSDLAIRCTGKCSRFSLKALTLIREGKLSLYSAEELLIQLMYTVSYLDSNCFGAMLEAANEILSARTSNLRNKELWLKLGLPEGLGKMILQFSNQQDNIYII